MNLCDIRSDIDSIFYICFRSFSSVSGTRNDTDSRNKQWFDLTQVAAAAI